MPDQVLYAAHYYIANFKQCNIYKKGQALVFGKMLIYFNNKFFD